MHSPRCSPMCSVTKQGQIWARLGLLGQALGLWGVLSRAPALQRAANTESTRTTELMMFLKLWYVIIMFPEDDSFLSLAGITIISPLPQCSLCRLIIHVLHEAQVQPARHALVSEQEEGTVNCQLIESWSAKIKFSIFYSETCKCILNRFERLCASVWSLMVTE